MVLGEFLDLVPLAMGVEARGQGGLPLPVGFKDFGHKVASWPSFAVYGAIIADNGRYFQTRIGPRYYVIPSKARNLKVLRGVKGGHFRFLAIARNDIVGRLGMT